MEALVVPVSAELISRAIRIFLTPNHNECILPSPSVSLEYTSSQLESTRSNLEGVSKQVREYMVSLGEWVDYVHPAAQSALPHEMITSGSPSGGLRVPITKTIASLLSGIFDHSGDFKGSSITRVLRIWLAHFQQFGTFVTKMSDEDREVLLIADSKIVQSRIDANLREKALQASAEEKVSLGQLGIRQGAVLEATSEVIDVATFKAKEESPLPSPS